MNKNNSRIINLIIITILLTISLITAIFYNINVFWLIIVSLFIPSLLLSIQIPQHIKKSLIFSLISIPLIIIIDYICTSTWQRLVPNPFFKYLLFWFVSIDTIARAFFSFYLTIISYKFFYSSEKRYPSINKRTKILLSIGITLLLIFIGLYYLKPQLLEIPYFFAIFTGIFIIIPLLITVLKDWLKNKSIIRLYTYFFIFYTILEFVALYLWWREYPWKYIMQLQALGYQIPIEEIIAFQLLFAPTILISYIKIWENKK